MKPPYAASSSSESTRDSSSEEEPAVASLLVAIPTTFLLIQSQTVRTMPVFLYLIFAAIGILLTLIGAYMGERIQVGPPPKPAE